MRFNGGGHINHSFFWKSLSPGQTHPTEALCAQINKDFGDMDCFKKLMSEKTTAIQGSGWGWLAFDKQFCRLKIVTCANQDPLEPTTGLVPIFGIDVWEHAYYLQYKNMRADYVKAIWDIVNWKFVSEQYASAIGH